MPARYFTYRYSGERQQIGSHGAVYNFAAGSVTQVDDNDDAEWFLHMGSPESGIYYFRETDPAGNPIGAFPPVNPELRQAFLDTRRFPTDRGVPPWQEWRLVTETMGDPTLYFHYIRTKLRRG
jgi:hypothetical protein